MSNSSHLSSLNTQQQIAVTTTDGPVLILAGAGAGKTKTLTHRIYHIIQKGIRPEAILAITFTNKAAAELRDRIRQLLDNEDEVYPFTNLPLAKTFHSLCVLILREHHEKLSLPRFFTILDKGDSLAMIKEATKKAPPFIEMKPAYIASTISSWKSEGLIPEDIESEASTNPRTRSILAIWKEYEKLLDKEKALDFDDLILKTVHFLEKNKHIVEQYHSRWSHIHIDEYQDTNGIQYRLSKLLVGPEKNICVVGDADQTIYMWRGANIQNILNFESDFKNAQTILLEQNYRSTKTILKAANDCIKKNTLRKEKNLFTENDDGEKINLTTYITEEDEAQGVVHHIQKLINNGVNTREIGILYRANYQSRALEEALVRGGIAYDLIGIKFFDRKEIKDILSYLRCAFNRTSLTDLKRASQFPKRGIGPASLEAIVNNNILSLSKGAREKVQSFIELLEQIKEKAEKSTVRETLLFILDSIHIEQEYGKLGDEGEERLQNVRELVSLASSFDSLVGVEGIEQFIETASLTSSGEEDKNQQAVKMMTVHSAKGLEFDYVFITGLEDGLFPTRKETLSKAEAEEERRLFYVALTRARKKLFLSYALSRRVFGSRMYSPPSEFVTEIDPDLIEQENNTFEQPLRRGGYLDDIEF